MINKHRLNVEMPIKGLHTDNEPFYQPDGYATYSLNAVHDSVEGSVSSLVNEPGNETCFSLPSGYRIVGAETIEEEIVIFSTNGTNSEIGIVNNCQYTTIVNNTCLNFGPFISSTHRVVRGCERIVYFVDGLNQDKQFNLDRLEDYKDVSGNFDCNLFLIQRDFQIPCLNVSSAPGSLDEGTYQFAIKYEDINGNTIGFSPLTQRLTTDEKSRFTIGLSSLDESIDRFRLVVYANTRTFLSPAITINSSTNSFYFTTLIDFEEISIDQVIIPQANYETSLAIEQVQNRLLRANVKEKDRDYPTLNQFSNSLNVDWSLTDIEASERTLMRDEVYALGIMYKYNDGTFSPVFHIHPDTTNGSSTSTAVSGQTIIGFTGDFTYNFNQLTGEISGSLTNVPPNYTVQINVDIEGFAAYNDATNQTSAPATVSWNSQVGFADDYETYIFTVTVVTPLGVLGSQSFTLTDLGTGNTDVLTNNITFPNNTSASTSTVNTATYDGGTMKGKLGAHRCINTTYNNPNCNVDFWGSLAGEFIHHHRVPNLDLAPIYDYSTNQRQGIQLEVTVPAYPDPDIVGHYIMYSRQEQTIDEKGIMANTHSHTPGSTLSGFEFNGITSLLRGSDTNRAYYFSQEQLFTLQDASLANIEKIGDYTLSETSSACRGFDGAGNAVFGQELDTFLGKRAYDATAFTYDRVVSSMTDQEYYFPRDFRNTNTSQLTVNTSLTNDFVIGDLGTPLNIGEFEMGYVAVKNQNEVYCALENIRYEPAQDCCDSSGTSIVQPQDVYISNLNFTNVAQGETGTVTFTKFIKILALMQTVAGAAALAAVAAPAAGTAAAGAASSAGATSAASAAIGTATTGAVTQVAVSGGTALASRIVQGLSTSNPTLFSALIEEEGLMDFIVLARGDFPADFGGSCRGAGAFTGDYTAFYAEYFSNVFVESRYNMDFRNKEVTYGCPSFYDGSYDLLTYLQQKVLIYDDSNSSEKPTPNPLPCVEEYYYDTNLLRESPQLFNGFSPDFYDLCSDCNGEFPERIVYSPISLPESRSDLYRVLRANDYVDMPAHRGDIISIKYEKNTLYVHTQESTFVMQPNPRTLQTSEETLFIGDGSFLSIPPQEMIQADVTVGGMQSVTASASSEAGYVWVDESNGYIFHSNKGRISDKGMHRFFRENLQSNLRAELIALGMDPAVNLNSTQVVYDPNFRRFIIRTVDYKPLFSYDLDPFVATRNYFDTSDLTFKDLNGVALDLTDVNLFENLSFTISYSEVYDSWSSFHSYLPDYLYYDNEYFYTSIGNQSWRHVRLNRYQNFYDTKSDYIIEYVDKSSDTFTKRSIQWFGHAYLYDATSRRWVEQNKTFERIWVRDDSVSTGLLSMIVDDDTDMYGRVVSWFPANPRLVRTDNIWKVSQLRDNMSDRTLPPETSEWLQIETIYPIDCVYNIPAHSFAKSQYEEPRIRSKWVKVRLYSNALEDIRLVTNLFIDKNKISTR